MWGRKVRGERPDSEYSVVEFSEGENSYYLFFEILTKCAILMLFMSVGRKLSGHSDSDKATL